MNRLRQLIISFALIWIVVKMGFFFTGNADEGLVIMVFLNLLLILLVEFFALRFKYKTITLTDSNFLDDVKSCLRSASTYVIVIVLFSVVYYNFLHPEFYADRVTDAITHAEEQAADPVFFEELVRRDTTMPEGTTPAQYVENVREVAQRGASWWFISGASLMLLMIVSIFNSVFITLLFRKVLLK